MTKTGLEMHRAIASAGEHSSSLLFRLYAWNDPSNILKLLPQCVPRILSTRRHPNMESFALTGCGTTEELRISSGHLRHHFCVNGTSPLPYPSLRQLHFGEGVKSAVVGLDPEQAYQLVTWLAPRQSKVEVSAREGHIPAKAVGALRETSLLRFV